MASNSKTEVAIVELLLQIRRRKVLFAGVLLTSLVVAIYYLVASAKLYRVEVRAIPYETHELVALKFPRNLNGPGLLKDFMKTAKSSEFQAGFYEELSKTSDSPQSVGLSLGQFQSRIAVKKMGDGYGMVNFSSRFTTEAETWMQALMTNASRKTMELVKVRNGIEITKVQEKITRMEAFFAERRESGLRKRFFEAVDLSKSFGVKDKWELYGPLLYPGFLFLFNTQEDLHLLKNANFDGVNPVKFGTPKAVAADRTIMRTVFVLLYALLAGLILGIFAVLLREYIANIAQKYKAAVNTQKAHA